MKSNKILTAVLLAGSMFFSGCAFLEFMEPGVAVNDVQTVSLTPSVSTAVSVLIENGNVFVVPTSSNELIVVVSNRVQASSRDIGHEFISNNLSGMVLTNAGSVSVNGNFEGKVDAWNIYAVYTTAVVYLPAGLVGSLQVSLVNGNIIGGADQTMSTVSLKTENGNVEFEGVHAATLVLKTVNGNLNADIYNIASAQIETENGNIDLSVWSMAIDSVADITTVNGNVEIAFDDMQSGADWSVSTVNGNIGSVFTMNAWDNLRVNAKKTNGEINYTIPFTSIIDRDSSFVGIFGDGSSLVNLSTVNGNIDIDF